MGVDRLHTLVYSVAMQITTDNTDLDTTTLAELDAMDAEIEAEIAEEIEYAEGYSRIVAELER